MRKASKNLPPLPVRAARMLARLRKLRGLSDAEKSVHALGLAATPQERWELFENAALPAIEGVKRPRSGPGCAPH